MAAEIHVNDVGTTFIATVKDQAAVVVNIAGATTKQLIFKKPDGTIVTKTAGFVTDGTDGKLQYVTIANDLDQAGSWQVEGYVVLTGGSWHTDIHSFTVKANLG